MYQKNSLGYSTDFPIPAYDQFDIGGFFIIKKSFGKLDLSGGARYDTRSFSGKAAYVDTTKQYFPVLYNGANPTGTPNVVQQFAPLNKNFSGASGSLGAAYNFSDAFLLKANIARGFRAPSIAELSANGADPGSQIYHVGNPNFKPEFSVQEDLGAFLTLNQMYRQVRRFLITISRIISSRNKYWMPTATRNVLMPMVLLTRMASTASLLMYKARPALVVASLV